MSKDSFFDKLDSKQSFTFGIVGGVLVLCTIGFLVLLSMYISGSSSFQVAETPTDTNQQQQKQQVNNDDNQQPTKPSGNKNINLAEVNKSDWARGAENPKITIVEFSDLECPFCKRFHDTMKQVMNNYGDQVQWVYRHAPLKQLHSKAPKEAEAAECVGDLGGEEKFWAFVDKIFSVTPSNNGLNMDKLPDYAADVGVNKQKFKNCLDSGRMSSEVQSDLQDAKSAGLRGTPYSVLIGPDGQKVPISGAQPYSKVKSLIESNL